MFHIRVHGMCTIRISCATCHITVLDIRNTCLQAVLSKLTHAHTQNVHYELIWVTRTVLAHSIAMGGFVIQNQTHPLGIRGRNVAHCARIVIALKLLSSYGCEYVYICVCTPIVVWMYLCMHSLSSKVILPYICVIWFSNSVKTLFMHFHLLFVNGCAWEYMNMYHFLNRVHTQHLHGN